MNRTFAHKLFGDSPAIGQRFLWSDGSPLLIAGVVEDGKYGSLSEDPSPSIFLPLAQSAEGDTTLVVRSSLPAADVAGELNRLVSGIDSSLPLNIEPWTDAMALVLFPARVATAALIAFAQGRVPSYVRSGIGPISPGRWQLWQFACRIGRMSRLNVTSGVAARAAVPSKMPRAVDRIIFETPARRYHCLLRK